MAQEICINQNGYNFDSVHNHCSGGGYILELAGLLFGFLIISFAEPIAFVAQILRAIRLKRIIDAQQSYFNQETRPSDLIARFQESRLLKTLVISIAIVSLVYIGAAVVLYFENHLYLMPSYDASSYSYYTNTTIN